MAGSSFVLMTLLSNHNIMSNMFDINNLKTQERNRLRQFKKEQHEDKLNHMRQYKALMFSSKNQKTNNLNSFKYYLNYNIKNENKR